MCGITGFIDSGNRQDPGILSRMTESLHHRGPDDSGNETISGKNYNIGFGFRRLAIIDLSALGHQPMKNENGSLVIVFNGEIYNYREIRKDLEKLGHRFNTQSDTEVIMKAYTQWGKKCVNVFTGMFAIALLDKEKEEVVFFRDRAGVKPLFYYHHENLFLFGSELKAFHCHPAFKKELNTNAIGLYFQHGYIPAPHCIFKYTHKLLPGHLLSYNLKNKSYSIEKYWDVNDYYRKPKLNISYADAVIETEKIMQKAFEFRMVADVPVGVFLSGGYDSSLVTALLQKNNPVKLKTFTIGFEEEKYNEAVYAREVANHLGTEHYEYTCTYKEAMDLIPLLPEMYDEPFADSSAIPTWLVSKMARQQVTVALSADGGDETFAGYTKYAKGISYLNRLAKLPAFSRSMASQVINLISQLKGNKNLAIPDRFEKLKLVLKSSNPAEAFNSITQAMTQRETDQLLKFKINYPETAFEQTGQQTFPETLDYFLALDYKTYLADDILQKVDRATMAVSLEGREPLLDHHIIEWVAQLPSDFKLQGTYSKRIIKDITHQYIPKKIMDRPKMGFNIPYEIWFKNELKNTLVKTLDPNKLAKQPYFNEYKISEMTADFFKSDHSVDFQRIWAVYNFQLWFEKWI